MTKPVLSVVVVSYNMARELPRTLRSMSPHMQRGIAAQDYEVIVVDNGSRNPFDEAKCRAWLPDFAVHRIPNAGPSPVHAINQGIERARGGLIGVFIDGARLASPGLLASACIASRLHEWPVIGALSFHLGPDIQTRSIRSGYDQRAEDALLARLAWDRDGYKLFDGSVLASSSQKGWFALPRETNALFLKAAHWHKLGGYDPGFVTPGGGLANLDIWARACGDPAAQVIMLLGEATFHQMHGGISTNAVASPMKSFEAEYFRLRGTSFQMPKVEPWYFALSAESTERAVATQPGPRRRDGVWGLLKQLVRP